MSAASLPKTPEARAVDLCDLVNAASMDDGCPVCMHILSPDLLQCGQRIGDEHNPCVVLLSQPGHYIDDCNESNAAASEAEDASFW